MKEISIVWHVTAESLEQAFWKPMLDDENLTFDEFSKLPQGGETERGEVVDLSYDDVIAAMKDRGCHGFVNENTRTIHAWVGTTTSKATVISMLAHEIGHLVGTPCQDPTEEEQRAEQFGMVAKMAHEFLEKRGLQ